MSARLLENQPPITVDGSGGSFSLPTGHPGAQALTLLPVGTIGRQTDLSTRARPNLPLGTVSRTRSAAPSEAKHEAANRILIPGPRSTSLPEFPPSHIPDHTQGAFIDVSSSGDTKEAVVGWNHIITEEFDLHNPGDNSTQHGKVSDGSHSYLIYCVQPEPLDLKAITRHPVRAHDMFQGLPHSFDVTDLIPHPIQGMVASIVSRSPSAFSSPPPDTFPGARRHSREGLWPTPLSYWKKWPRIPTSLAGGFADGCTSNSIQKR